MNGYLKNKQFQRVIGASVVVLLLWGSTSKDRRENKRGTVAKDKIIKNPKDVSHIYKQLFKLVLIVMF